MEKAGEEVANRYELMGDRNRGKKLVVQMITTVSEKASRASSISSMPSL